MQICYIHHPPRNLYGYATGSNLQKYWPVRLYTTFINFFLRNYDFKTAQRVDYFIANSKETARRVEKFYRRESIVIYPPIETQKYSQDLRTIPGIGASLIPGMRSSLKRAFVNLTIKSYYLSVGRLSWAKRVDLIIEACNRLKLPLKIVGIGNEEDALKKIARSTVEFLGSVSDEELATLYSNAKALIFTALDEDFGMVPVEAMAYGTPVIGLSQGGVKETVIDNMTGVLFDKPTVGSLTNAIQRFEKLSKGKDWATACLTHAKKFSKEEFKRKIKEFVEEKLP